MIKRFYMLVFSLMFVPSAWPNSGDVENKLVIVYDSRVHALVGDASTFFSVEKYDVSLVGKIEAEINKRLTYSGKHPKNIDAIQSWATDKFKNDDEIIRLVKLLEEAYSFTEPAMKFGLSKVPAIVLVDDEDEFVVYGETNIYKALERINAFRATH